MPFGLSNIPAIFQGYVNKILAKKLDVFIIVYLNDILIYIKDPGQPHIEAVHWILDQLRKYSLFANLKKCYFHQDEIHFLGYVVSSKGINIKTKKIEVFKEWLEPKSVQDIQVFLGFANFYQRFIQGFSRMAASLTSMLKTTILPEKSTPERLGVDDDEVDRFGVGGNGVKHAKKSGKLSKSEKSKSEKTSKSRNLAKSGKKLSKSGNSTNFDTTEDRSKFLTPGARTAFNCLRLAFTEALILQHFDPEYHIWIEIDISGYAIGGILSQLTSETSPNGIIIKTDLD